MDAGEQSLIKLFEAIGGVAKFLGDESLALRAADAAARLDAPSSFARGFDELFGSASSTKH